MGAHGSSTLGGLGRDTACDAIRTQNFYGLQARTRAALEGGDAAILKSSRPPPAPSPSSPCIVAAGVATPRREGRAEPARRHPV